MSASAAARPLWREIMHKMLKNIPVRISGSWFPKPKRDWNGTAIADGNIVSVVFLESNGATHWCISDKGDTPSLPIRIVFFDYDNMGLEVQVNFSIGSSDGYRRLACTVNSKEYIPTIPNELIVQTGRICELASVEAVPKIQLKMLFLAQHDVKVYRDGIWHIRKELQDSFPLSGSLIHGRTGTISGTLRSAY